MKPFGGSLFVMTACQTVSRPLPPLPLLYTVTGSRASGLSFSETSARIVCEKGALRIPKTPDGPLEGEVAYRRRTEEYARKIKGVCKNDSDGLYVIVTSSGCIAFKDDYYAPGAGDHCDSLAHRTFSAWLLRGCGRLEAGVESSQRLKAFPA